ncbi:hypothetical protein SUNI508_06706 [Seiridium unicorne]|uniref:Uncharacterized protein n=1 Tax=Seiridium unicorne TaxID=138068 RepID=A0ABR2V0I8_9PEZI
MHPVRDSGPQSVLEQLIQTEADDALIFQVINTTKDVNQQGTPLRIASRLGMLQSQNRFFRVKRRSTINHMTARGPFSKQRVKAPFWEAANSDPIQYIRAFHRASD